MKQLQETFGDRSQGLDIDYKKRMKGKILPCKWSEVPFEYQDAAMMKHKFKMTILAGFVGMSVDK